MTDWIVITAPGSGIGQSITPYLLGQGYGILGMGRQSSLEYLQTLDFADIHAIACDYTSEQSMEQAFATARSEVDRIVGLIHLVGGSLVSRRLEMLDLATFKQVLAVNTDSTFLAGREAVRWMKETGGGNLIFFGSTTGFEPSAGKLAYGVAKAAVHTMTQSFALETSGDQIICNTIAPSYVMTERHQQEIASKVAAGASSRVELLEQLQAKNPLHQILDPSELLPTVDLLLHTKVIQGQILRVDLGQVGIA